MEHDLLALVLAVNAVPASLSVLGVEPSSVALVFVQENLGAKHLQEGLHGRAVSAVPEQGLLAGLTELLIDHAELERVHQNMPACQTRRIRIGCFK